MGSRKSPPSLIDLFERVVPREAGIERRRMFGYPAATRGRTTRRKTR